MSDSEDGILDVVVEEEGGMEHKYDMAKLKMLRDSARFIRNVEKTYKQHMAYEKWKKLNMLANILESNMTPAQFFTQFPDNKIRKIEAVIAKLKAKFTTLWDPTDVIVINDGEPSTSTAATTNRQQTEERASTSTSAAKSRANPSASNMTNAVSGTAKKALEKANQTDAKNANASPKTLPAVKQCGVVRKSNSAASPAATATKAAKEIVQKTKATTTPKAATVPLNSKPAASTKAATSTSNVATMKSNSKTEFERRAKPNTISLDLTSSPSTLDFEPRDSRRQEFVRVIGNNTKSPVRTQSPVGVSSPSAVKDPLVFSRRSRFAPLQPTPPPDFERRCNPSPPAAVTTADCLPDEVRLKSPSFQEARKKLAALSGTNDNNNTASKVTATATFHTLPLASNCNDPRGRNSSYLNSTLSPPKPVQTIVGLQAPLSPVPPPPNINGTWSSNNIPVKEFQRAQSIPAATSPNNNNNNHNLNLNKSRNHNLVSGSPIREMPPFERGCFPSSNSKKVNGKEPPRRFNNMSSGSEPRDPRCAGGNNWGNNNGPGSQQKQQATYSGQGRGRGAPYNNGYNEDNWQTSNNNFSYNNKNGSNNNNNNNNNNNQMSWNANNSNHFNKNVNVNKSNANFGFRPAYNRERGSAGNATTIGNNNNNNSNNNNPHASGSNNINNNNNIPVSNEPRTYREYLLAKEKRQKEAAEKQRKLDEAEKQRKLEAAEKQSQLDDSTTNEVVASIEKVQTDNVQLDTSYRNLQLPGSNKKIDFKIPKKASVEKPKAAETMTVAREKSDKTNKSDDVEVVVETWDKEQSSGNNKETGEVKRDANKSSHKTGGKVIKASKVHKSEKVSKKDKTDKVNKSDREDKIDGSLDKVKHSDKRDDSPKPKNKPEKIHDKEKLTTETDKDQDKDRRVNKQKDKSAGADKPNEMECKDNVENEPPALVDNTENVSKPVDRLSEVETEDSEQASPRRSRSRSSSKAKLKEKPVEKEKTVEKEKEKAVEKEEEQKVEQEQKDEKKEHVEKLEQNVDTIVKDFLEEKPKEEKPPKLPKLKVVLGPNAHAMVVIPADDVSSKEPESEPETTPKPQTELRRIMQRRKSMMPVSSKPLVDKQELFGGSSLDYEDLVEHKREQERQEKQQASVTEPETTQEKRINKNLAVMFEKSNDNCSISTHNILAGKRRSRLNGLTLNETELQRSVFQLSALKATSAAAISTKSNATAATKRKRGRPAAGKCADEALLEKQPPAKRQRVKSNSSASTEDVAQPTSSLPAHSTTAVPAEPAKSTQETGATTTAPLAPPPPKRKAKRNELDKLTDDIAQMYYANDVMRATGRRACTTQQHSLAEQDSSRSSSLSRGNRSRSSSIGNMSNQNNAELAPYSRNVARRGHPFAVGRDLDRASSKAKQQQTIQTKRCQVRVAR